MAETAPAQALKSVGHREQRRKSRKSAEDLCLVTVEMEPAGFGLMLDVSESGVGVQVMNRIEPGTDVQIAFKVPELAARIEGSGVITWCDGDGRVGIRFQQLKGQSGDHLKQWVDSLPESTIHEPLEVAPRRTQPVLREQVRAIQAQIAASQLDVDLVLQFLVERVVELTHSNGGAIALGEGEEMICRASTGLAPDLGVKIGSGSALTSECLRTGKILRCDDTETDPRVDREICRELNLRSSLILPILVEAQVRGVLEIFSPLPNAFGQQHLALLQQLAVFTSQIVYGPLPASAAEIELSAKSHARPEHTALSALLTATTKAAEIGPSPTKAPSPPPSITAPVVPPKQVSPAAPVVRKPAPPIAAAATQPARAKTKEIAPQVTATAIQPPAGLDRPSASELSLETDEESSRSRIALYIGLVALLLVLLGLGWWYKSKSAKPVQPPIASSPATPQPATTYPVPTSTPLVKSQPSQAKPLQQQAKPLQQQVVAADTVRSPDAAIVNADPSTPLVIAARNRPLPKSDTSTMEVPSVNITSGANLAGINLPGATSRPELRAQGVVTGGQLLRRVEPNYPPFAKQQRIQGDVVLSARVTKDGTVEHIQKTSGSPVLEPAAVAAVRQWKYDPYKLNGQAQDVDIVITVQFRLKQ
jgi:TonB family protein